METASEAGSPRHRYVYGSRESELPETEEGILLSVCSQTTPKAADVWWLAANEQTNKTTEETVLFVLHSALRATTPVKLHPATLQTRCIALFDRSAKSSSGRAHRSLRPDRHNP